jgi:hypothetical protein
MFGGVAIAGVEGRGMEGRVDERCGAVQGASLRSRATGSVRGPGSPSCRVQRRWEHQLESGQRRGTCEDFREHG